jgi:hypothetical protein
MIEETETEIAAGGACEALQPASVNAAIAVAVMAEPKLPPFKGD